MNISSRTPEGRPNRCPICEAEVRIEPSALFGDAPCPTCGSLLWFVGVPEHMLIFEYEAADEIRDRTLEFLAEQLGVSVEKLKSSPNVLEEIGADSLDLVELMMELEDEFEKRR